METKHSSIYTERKEKLFREKEDAFDEKTNNELDLNNSNNNYFEIPMNNSTSNENLNKQCLHTEREINELEIKECTSVKRNNLWETLEKDEDPNKEELMNTNNNQKKNSTEKKKYTMELSETNLAVKSGDNNSRNRRLRMNKRTHLKILTQKLNIKETNVVDPVLNLNEKNSVFNNDDVKTFKNCGSLISNSFLQDNYLKQSTSSVREMSFLGRNPLLKIKRERLANSLSLLESNHSKSLCQLNINNDEEEKPLNEQKQKYLNLLIDLENKINFQLYQTSLCIICMSNISQKHCFYLKCGHCFHKACIKSWIRHKPHCPICKDNNFHMKKNLHSIKSLTDIVRFERETYVCLNACIIAFIIIFLMVLLLYNSNY